MPEYYEKILMLISLLAKNPNLFLASFYLKSTLWKTSLDVKKTISKSKNSLLRKLFICSFTTKKSLKMVSLVILKILPLGQKHPKGHWLHPMTFQKKTTPVKAWEERSFAYPGYWTKRFSVISRMF